MYNPLKSIQPAVTLLIAFCYFSLSESCLAQTSGERIEMIKTFGGVKFSQSGRALRPRDVLQTMESNADAHEAFTKAKTNLDMATVFGGVGGFMIGWPLGTAIAGGDPQWGLVAAGAGLALMSIPFSSYFKKHATNAVEIYNGDVSVRAKPLRVDWMPYGAGLRAVIWL
jgi:hypothetical protein